MTINLESRDYAHYLTIDRADKRNALNEAVARGLIDALDAAEADANCRVVVITGAGDKAFCAGGDLGSTNGDAPFDVDPSDPRNFVVALFERMEACRLPIVARVNGHALAGGLGLLCACDLAITVDSAKFGTPEVGIGVFPMMILPFLARVLPARKLLELCLTGDPVDAHEALAIGLVNKVVAGDQLDVATRALVDKLASRSPTAIRLGKQGARAMRDMAITEALEYAQLMIATMARTRDAAEGIAAFRGKRPPEWSGK
jgi:enoyl-CoA hydratase/carnithine racemase